MKKRENKVPIQNRSILTFEEASDYSGIGINRLRSLAHEDGCKWIIYVGTQLKIKRIALDEFILSQETI